MKVKNIDWITYWWKIQMCLLWAFFFPRRLRTHKTHRHKTSWQATPSNTRGLWESSGKIEREISNDIVTIIEINEEYRQYSHFRRVIMWPSIWSVKSCKQIYHRNRTKNKSYWRAAARRMWECLVGLNPDFQNFINTDIVGAKLQTWPNQK